MKEAEKEAKFQGITVEEALASHDPDAVPPPPAAENNEGAGAGEPATPILPPNPKVTRVTPPEKQDPAVRYKDAASEKDKTSEWGVGDEGYKPPSSPSDKMRKNVPYKVRLALYYSSASLLNSTDRNVCSINSVVTGAISEYMYHVHLFSFSLDMLICRGWKITST